VLDSQIDHYIKFGSETDGRVRVVQQATRREQLVPLDTLVYLDWLSSQEGPHPPYEDGAKPDGSQMQSYGSRDIPKAREGWSYGLQVLLRFQGCEPAWWMAKEGSFVGNVLTRMRDRFFTDPRSREGWLSLHMLVASDPPKPTRRGGPHRKFYAPKFNDTGMWRARDTLRLPDQTVRLPELVESLGAHRDDDLFPEAQALLGGAATPTLVKPTPVKPAEPPVEPDLDDEILF
jgi:hypothetical protein